MPTPCLHSCHQVKTGSSFNAMVRALKQDLVSSGALARGSGPAALYEVDKASKTASGACCGSTVLAVCCMPVHNWPAPLTAEPVPWRSLRLLLPRIGASANLLLLPTPPACSSRSIG